MSREYAAGTVTLAPRPGAHRRERGDSRPSGPSTQIRSCTSAAETAALVDRHFKYRRQRTEVISAVADRLRRDPVHAVETIGRTEPIRRMHLLNAVESVGGWDRTGAARLQELRIDLLGSLTHRHDYEYVLRDCRADVLAEFAARRGHLPDALVLALPRLKEHAGRHAAGRRAEFVSVLTQVSPETRQLVDMVDRMEALLGRNGFSQLWHDVARGLTFGSTAVGRSFTEEIRRSPSGAARILGQLSLADAARVVKELDLGDAIGVLAHDPHRASDLFAALGDTDRQRLYRDLKAALGPGLSPPTGLTARVEDRRSRWLAETLGVARARSRPNPARRAAFVAADFALHPWRSLRENAKYLLFLVPAPLCQWEIQNDLPHILAAAGNDAWGIVFVSFMMRAVGKSAFGGRLDGRTFEETKLGSTQFSLFFGIVFGVNSRIAQAFGIGGR